MTRIRSTLREARWLAPWLIIAVALAVGIYAVGVLSARVDSLAAALDAEQAAAEDRGETPVAPPADDLIDDPAAYPGPQGPAGEDGTDGRGIVYVRCISDTWSVMYTDGEYDSDAGDCTGDQGPQGTPGEDSTIPGPAGQDGTNGTDGQDGSDGRGITDAHCDPATGRWVITYTDGTRDDDAGPCRQGLL